MREAVQMGFTRCLMPETNIDPADRSAAESRCELVGLRTVGDALDEFFS